MTAAAEDDPTAAALRHRRISGTAVVVSMLMLGLAATTVMYVYWDLHTKPFRPLTEAIGRRFRHSLPKVEGGRHKQGPMTLRVAFRVPFSPAVDDQETEETLAIVKDLIRRHQDLTGYEHVQLHLFQLVPEETAKSQKFEFTPDEIVTQPVPASSVPHRDGEGQRGAASAIWPNSVSLAS